MTMTSRWRRKRAFLLAMVMVLSLILLIFGMAYLGTRSRQYKSVQQASLEIQAQELARAGIEDARVKFDRDVQFPPTLAIGQYTFNYGEDVVDASNTYLGSYRVVVNMTYSRPPFSVAIITSTGFVGPASAPTGQHTYSAYLNLDPAGTYGFVRWDDLGCP
jgi:hypothetical protein